MLQEIAFKAHCKQMKDLNGEVLRLAITEQTSALWEDVKESVARGQFAVLTFFIENDETIYRFGHLTFQEHLCSMVVNRMLATEMDRVKAIMTASGGLKKMLQGSWWLTVTQFCIEGLMVEGAAGEALAARFAETMLDEVVDKDGVVKLTAKEIHSFDSMSAFAALLKHNHRVTALELGDAKTEINAEWLSQLCPALAGHPTLRRLTLRRMVMAGEKGAPPPPPPLGRGGRRRAAAAPRRGCARWRRCCARRACSKCSNYSTAASRAATWFRCAPSCRARRPA